MISLEEIELAERSLRPTAEQALAAWRVLVEAEKQQVEALPNRPRPEDFYGPIAQAFRADPHRRDEPLLEHLRSLVRPEESWLDLGAGAGRYALPIALLARRVYAVEPSPGMVQALRESLAEYAIDNVEVFVERWPGESRAPIADVGLICQVGYDIADLGPFLDQLEGHTRRLCVAVLFEHSPTAYFAPLWQAVHGERRVLLPGLAEFTALLFARGRSPRADYLLLPERAHRDMESLHAASRRPLWVVPGSAEDERLAAALRELARPTAEGGYSLSPGPRRLAIVTWSPA
jgi:SAM-dependent methyltransferase